MPKKRGILLLLTLALLACSRESGKPVAEKPITEQPATYLKWLVRLSDKELSTVELSVFPSPRGIIPQTGGNYVAVVSRNKKAISAFPFKFPTHFHMEGIDAQGRRVAVNEKLTGDRTAAVWIRLEEPIDTLEIMGSKKKKMLTETKLSDGTPLSSIRPMRPAKEKKGGGCGLLWAAESNERPYRYLQPEEGNLLPGQLLSRIDSLLVPMTNWTAEVERQADLAAPQTLSGMTHIGFARYASTGSGGLQVIASTVGSVMIINVNMMNTREFRDGTVVHEIAHAYEDLLGGFRGNRGGLWTQEVRHLAQRTMDRFGLDFHQSFDGLWNTTHNTAKHYELTLDYQGNGWINLDSGRAAAYGFASPYGSMNYHEDIAEYVQFIQAASTAGESAVCGFLRNNASRPDARLALPYIKILMLKNAGFLTAERAEACYGNILFRGPRGIHFYKESMERPFISFTSNLKAGYSVEKNVNYFNVLGDGPNTYQLGIQVVTQNRLGQKKIPPIGLYRLDNIGPLSIYKRGNNGVYLAHEKNDKARASASGLVLITEYTRSRVEGAIFFLALRSGMGGAELMTLFPLGGGLPVPLPVGSGLITDRFPLVTFKYGD